MFNIYLFLILITKSDQMVNLERAFKLFQEKRVKRYY